MTDSTYYLAALAWSIGGLAAGYGMGRTARGSSDRVKDTIVGVLVLLIIAVSTTLYVQQGARLAEFAECQARANAAILDSLAARSEASKRQNATAKQQLLNQKRYLLTLRGAASLEERITATDDYDRSLDEQIAAIDKVEQARQANPLLAPDCGEPT